MATDRQTIGPHLASAAPFHHLPGVMLRALGPLFRALGDAVAIQGFREFPCADKLKTSQQKEETATPAGSTVNMPGGPLPAPRWCAGLTHATPQFMQDGMKTVRFTINADGQQGGVRVPLKFSARFSIAMIGYLTKGNQEFITIHANCPQLCQNSWVKGTFAVEILGSISMNNPMAQVWNHSVRGTINSLINDFFSAPSFKPLSNLLDDIIEGTVDLSLPTANPDIQLVNLVGSGPHGGRVIPAGPFHLKSGS